MADRTISPLRSRMIEDMTIRGFGAKTQADYVRNVKRLAAFLDCSPDTATAEDIRRFQLHLTETGVGAPTINGTVSALRFFFKVTLGRNDIDHCTQFVRRARKPPWCSAGGSGTADRVCAGTGRGAVSVWAMLISPILSPSGRQNIPILSGQTRHPGARSMPRRCCQPATSRYN